MFNQCLIPRVVKIRKKHDSSSTPLKRPKKKKKKVDR